MLKLYILFGFQEDNKEAVCDELIQKWDEMSNTNSKQGEGKLLLSFNETLFILMVLFWKTVNNFYCILGTAMAFFGKKKKREKLVLIKRKNSTKKLVIKNNFANLKEVLFYFCYCCKVKCFVITECSYRY